MNTIVMCCKNYTVDDFFTTKSWLYSSVSIGGPSMAVKGTEGALYDTITIGKSRVNRKLSDGIKSLYWSPPSSDCLVKSPADPATHSRKISAPRTYVLDRNEGQHENAHVDPPS